MTVPRPGPDLNGTIALFPSALLTGTYVASNVIDVADFREITLLCAVTGASAANAVTILPLLSAGAAATKPAATDDVWFAPSVYDGSVTAAALSATLLSGADFGQNPPWGGITLRPTNIKLADTVGTTDPIRIAITVKCAWATWFHIQCADTDGTGTRATMVVTAAGSS